MVSLLIPVIVFGFCFFAALLKWNEMKYRKEGLPPGTLGWPLFGETVEFLKQGPFFMKKQTVRYGKLFKSHIFGCPTVISCDPETNRYIFMNEGKGFVPGYPQSLLDIMGKYNIANVHGALHKSMRGALLALVGPSIIKDQLLSKIDAFMQSHLSNWDGKIIDIQDKTKEMWLLSALKMVVNEDLSQISKTIMPEFEKLLLGTMSMPINLPGTNYRRGLQARMKVSMILRQIIKERRASNRRSNDMLDLLLTNDDFQKLEFTDDHIIDVIITILYSGFETVSTTSMMAVKYLHDNPKALQDLRKEHSAIREGKKPGEGIDWNDYKSMNFTRAVINETLRLGTIVNGVLRKTTQDWKTRGMVIPKGWKIYLYTRELNYDPIHYSEPLSFNPWRWLEKNMESTPHYMMFGGGSRLCPGKELAMVEISIFLHYLATRYRWEMKDDKILKFPRVEAPNGLHMTVWNHSTDMTNEK